jgi:nucleoside-diphosphate-sugar epimerase
METVLVTGGAGFFGRHLKRKLLSARARCVSVDLCRDGDRHENACQRKGRLAQ